MQLEDLRTKNAKMVAEKVAQREKSKESESTDSLTSPHGSSKRSSSGGDPAYDKLQRDYRRARKEVSAAVLSKDQAKLKQEVRPHELSVSRLTAVFTLTKNVSSCVNPCSELRKKGMP